MTLEYVNRRGDRYFVLQGKTKTGKPKFYSSKRPGGVGVDELPPEFEIYESPATAIVSVRKTRPTRILPFERELLTRLAGELARTPVLVDVEEDALVVYAPDMDPAGAARLIAKLTDGRPLRAVNALGLIARISNYSPMLRFALVNEDERLYALSRWCYRSSIDDWLFLTAGHALEPLARKCLQKVGDDSFFELF